MPTTDLDPPTQLRPPPDGPLTIQVVEDPLRVRHGFPISSTYVETFWLTQLGPSAICLLRLIDRATRHRPDRRLEVAIVDLATMLGTPGTGSRNSTITRRIDRLVRFGAAYWDSTDQSQLTVWSHLDTVPAGTRSRWPTWLNETHTQAFTERKAM